MVKRSYTIEYAEAIADDLADLRAYERKNILTAIEKQLLYEPTRETRHRKIIVGLIPPWDHAPPIWQLYRRVSRILRCGRRGNRSVRSGNPP